jgi:hypothetical protein
MATRITDLVNSLVLISTGEYAYSVDIAKNSFGLSINAHSNQKDKPDIVVTIEQMKADFKNLQWLAVQVPWFATHTDIARARILPKVETSQNKMPWQVAGYDRSEAEEIKRNNKGELNYGGTPSDEVLVNFCKYLKAQKLKIMLMPILYVDDEAKSWAGNIASRANLKKVTTEVDEFFRDRKYGYNNFILHYAKLLKNHIDVIAIGAELKGITLKNNQYNQFPGVRNLIGLAHEVKLVVGDAVKTTYIANYGEYHHADNGLYALDSLWGNTDLDIITLYANFPLSKELASCKAVKQGLTSGEGYDYYINGNDAVVFEDPTWAWKNYQFWYETYHYEQDVTTAWDPDQLKQLNLIYNSLASPNVIAAWEVLLKEQNIVKQAFLNYYDSRPFPYYPNDCASWNDCKNWQFNSVVNGKLQDKFVDLAGCFEPKEL